MNNFNLKVLTNKELNDLLSQISIELIGRERQAREVIENALNEIEAICQKYGWGLKFGDAYDKDWVFSACDIELDI